MSQALASGAFVTTVEGRRCTAVPKPGSKAANALGSNNDGGNADSADSVAETTAAAITTSKNSQSTTTSTPQITTTSTTSSTSTSSTSSTFIALIDTSTDVALQAASKPPPESSPPSSPVTITFPTSSEADQDPPQASQPPQAILPPAIQTSQADTSITTASEATAKATIQQFSEITIAPTPTDGGVNAQFTTIGTAPTNDPAEQSTDATSSTNGAVSAVPASNGNTVQSTVAVAGGVIGGVVALSTIAFFIWWWRRRMVKRRRSTLLTPLTVDNMGRPTGGGEKGSYEINRSSIGPTPVAEKVRNAIGYNVKMIRGRVSRIVTRNNSTSSPSVNMNRGNSQFMDPVSTHSRANSSALSGGSGADVTSKDRFLDWWSRLTADVNFNWRLRNKDPKTTGISSRSMNEKTTSTGSSQPDFLTLLGMDERELDREAQRRRASVARKAGSAGSADHFLGGLNLSFSGNNNNSSPDDPFNDANALPRNSAKPGPLVVSQANNPFSDANAIRNPAGPKPTTYVADMRRSRNQSIGGGGNNWPAPAGAGGYRESVASVESYATRRNNKFRSDPFDLERPELLASARQAKASMSSSTAGTAGSSSSDWPAAGGPPRDSRLSGGVGTGGIRRPPGAHQRSDSFSSKYSSGVSMGDWSDPGPDVGPAAARKDGPEARESPTQAWRNRIERDAAKAALKRNPSSASDRSVGKAM